MITISTDPLSDIKQMQWLGKVASCKVILKATSLQLSSKTQKLKRYRFGFDPEKLKRYRFSFVGKAEATTFVSSAEKPTGFGIGVPQKAKAISLQVVTQEPKRYRFSLAEGYPLDDVRHLMGRVL